MFGYKMNNYNMTFGTENKPNKIGSRTGTFEIFGVRPEIRNLVKNLKNENQNLTGTSKITFCS